MSVIFRAGRSTLALFSAALSSAAILGFGAGSLEAATIISDGFSGTNNTTLNNRTPDGIDLPGTTFTSYTNAVGPYAEPVINTSGGNPSPAAETGFNGGAYISIASAGPYTKPPTITLSADLELNNIQSDGTYRGVGLGFFSGTPTGGEVTTTFTGLSIDVNGTLRLITPNTPHGTGSTVFAASFPGPGGFSSSAFYTLSYTVNTTTGTISNVIYNGTDVSSDFAVTATGFQSTLVGFEGNTANDPTLFGLVDNFSVSGVPEPASLSVLLIGGLGLLRRRRHA